MKGGQRRLHVTTPTRARIWLRGPRWKKLGGVVTKPETEVYGRLMFGWPPRALLVYDFEDDIRELILPPALQFDRRGMWSDPREQLGIKPPKHLARLHITFTQHEKVW